MRTRGKEMTLSNPKESRSGQQKVLPAETRANVDGCIHDWIRRLLGDPVSQHRTASEADSWASLEVTCMAWEVSRPAALMTELGRHSEGEARPPEIVVGNRERDDAL